MRDRPVAYQDGARPRQQSRATRWLFDHLRALVYSLGQMARTPGTSLVTAAVIGISMALPAGFHVFLENVKQVSIGWDHATQISLFLQRHLDDHQASVLAERLRQSPHIHSVEMISKQQALDEYRSLSGFGKVLDVLDENPLPAVLIVEPSEQVKTATASESLLAELRQLSEVDIAQLDIQWVQRFYTLLAVGQRAMLLLAGLLAVAVLLIIGNTIRLAIQSRQAEIDISRLFGATYGFIRKPFVYSGLIYGLVGGLIAWLFVCLGVMFLAPSVKELATLYYSAYRLQGLSYTGTLVLLFTCVCLGVLGAWVSVGSYLRATEKAR